MQEIIVDSNILLGSLKERFDPLHKESQHRVVDDFADQISFFSCNRNPKERELHISRLDYLCLTTKPHCC